MSSLFIMLGILALLVCAISFSSGQSHAMMNGMRGNNLMMQRKQIFDELGSALHSGNLEDAKMAFAKLKKNASPQAKSASNPMRAEIDNLGKALDFGELQGAQEAYLKMQEKMKRLRNSIRSTP